MDTFANVYDNSVGGFDDHYVQCYNCMMYLHFDNVKNIVIGATYHDMDGLFAAVWNDDITYAADDDHFDADEAGEYVWNK